MDNILQSDNQKRLFPYFIKQRVKSVSVLKNPPAAQETQVRSLGWEDLLIKEAATHSRILAWEIPWTEEPGRLQAHLFVSHKELDTTE